MVDVNNAKEIHISVITERLDIVYSLTQETVAEDVIISVCKTLKIGPVTRHLFGLRVNKKYWVALNHRLWDLNRNKLYFRVRFKIPILDKLRCLDPQAFNYYFFQVRRDVLDGDVSDINWEKHKRELMGLGVTDMYRDVLESGINRLEALNNYKKYIPKEIAKNHLFFAKKRMDENLSLIIKRGGHDVSYLKSGYLEEFEGMAPDYLIEDYEAWIMESDANKVITIKVDPYHDDMPGIQYKSSDSNEWQHICSIEDLCFISIRTDGSSVEISRKTGIPMYIIFNSISTTISFASLLDGYYRLSVKWTFNLCKDLTTPSLVKLKKLKCHGPVGGEFSYAKLEEKRNNKPGCYILRESETTFDSYYLDVCNQKSNTPVTFRIISMADGSFWYSADKECYKSIQAIIEKYSCTSKALCLIECLPSSEYEESNLLLCQQTEIKSASCSTVKSQIGSYGPTQCIHVKNLQIFRGKVLDDSFTQLYKCLWKRSKKERVEVALKSLKPCFHDHFLKDFLKLASCWGLLQSSSFVNLLGVTLSDPISMVMEYFPMGPLDKYLQANKKLIKEVDLVEAVSYLSNALWLMEEEGFAHGYIRCEKILVASHSDNSFCVRLSDPGLFQNYNEFDLHWIPPELYEYPEAARKNLSADIWAFGTTLWEIFSYGEKPPSPCLRDTTIGESFNIRQYYKNGYKLKIPKTCPRYVYSLMEECWHLDPALRKKPQAAKRDINQFLYQVFNSRLKHPYATILPTNKSKSSSFDTLNDVCSDALDDYSLRSMSTQLSVVSWCDDSSSPNLSVNFSDLEPDSLHVSQHNFTSQISYDFSSQVSTIIPNWEFNTAASSMGGISSLQSIFELNQDVNVVLQGKIGQGFYGEVYQGVIEDMNSSSDPQKVAVKRLRNFDNTSWFNDFLREIDIMKKLKHPCIVEMKCVILEPEVNLVMEYVPHGSLKCYLKINKDRLDTKIHILKYALDVAKGMDYLGKMKIVHRDLAARNVLVADEFSVKISDFGLAQCIGPSDYYISQSNRELPIKWFAPESLRYGKFSGQSDVWSYGVTLFEMFSFGEEPIIETFEESSTLLDALDKGIRLARPNSCPNEVYVKLMFPCWNNEGKNRPLFSNIIHIVEQLRLD